MIESAKNSINKDRPPDFPLMTTMLDLSAKNRAARFESYAHHLHKKRDFEMAEKALVQASIDDLESLSIIEALEYTKAKLIEYIDPTTDSMTLGDARFNFLIVTLGRSASTAIQTLLCLHPEMFVLPKRDIAGALQTNTEEGLLIRYQRQMMDHNRNLKVGLLAHGWGSVLHRGKEEANRLSKVVGSDTFLQSVREPARLLRSIVNNEIISVHAGAHKFEPIVPDSVFSVQKPISLLEASHFNKSVSNTEQPIHSLTCETRVKVLEEVKFNVKPFAIGNIWQQHFADWRTLDFTLESKLREGGGARRAIELIATDLEYDHPLFRIPINSTDQQIMVQNFIFANVDGGQLMLGLSYVDMCICSYTFPIVELIRFDPPLSWIEAGLGNRMLAMTVVMSTWEALPRKTRIDLIQTEVLERFAREFLVPAWIHNYLIWKKAIDPVLADDGDPAFRRLAYETNGDDIAQFFKVHPHYEELWPEAREFL